MLRVAITGASGLIGSGLAEALLGRGDEVVGFSRDPNRAAAAGNPQIAWRACDLAASPPESSTLRGVDAIVNLAGEPINQRWNEAAKQRIMASRVDATANLVRAIADSAEAPGVLVSGSAVGYYGDSGDREVDETGAPGSSFDCLVCERWEKAAEAARQSGVRVAISRTGLVLDRRGGLLKDLLVPFRLGVGGPVAGGDQYMPWIHLDDLVALLIWLIDSEFAQGPYNATAPNPINNRDFSKALGKALGRPAVMAIPKAALRLRLGRELAAVAAGGTRAVPKRALAEGFRFTHPNLGAALTDVLSRRWEQVVLPARGGGG